MTLSDEDYGILYNAIEQTPHGYGTHFATSRSKYEVAKILREYNHIPTIAGFDNQGTFQTFLDTAAFIILSEGRELP